MARQSSEDLWSIDNTGTKAGWTRAAGHAELVVLQAQTLAAAEDAISIVRSNGTVVLNCAAMPAPLAQRLIDLVRGGLCAIDGLVDPIGTQVLLLRPALSRITA